MSANASVAASAAAKPVPATCARPSVSQPGTKGLRATHSAPGTSAMEATMMEREGAPSARRRRGASGGGGGGGGGGRPPPTGAVMVVGARAVLCSRNPRLRR